MKIPEETEYRKRRAAGARGQSEVYMRKGDGLLMGGAKIKHSPSGSGLRRYRRDNVMGVVHGRGRLRRRGSL